MSCSTRCAAAAMVALLVVAGAAEGQTALSCGQNLGAALSSVGEVDTYLLQNVAQGDRITIRMRAATLTGGSAFRPRVELYDGSSALIASSPDGEINFLLSTAGPYTLLAAENANSGAGSYILFLQRLNNPCLAAPLPCGITRTSFATTERYHTYVIDASAGDINDLTFVDRGTSSFFERLEVWTPDGTRIGIADQQGGSGSRGARFTFTASAPAPYVVFAISLTNAVGSYSLQLQRLNSPCGTSELSCGQTVTTSISEKGERHYYILTGLSPGDRLRLWMVADTRSAQGLEELVVYDAAGNVVATTPFSSGGVQFGTARDFTATGAGPYLVRAASASDRTPFAYRLLFQRLSNPCHAPGLACGTAIDASVSAIGEIDSYAVDGFSVGDRVTFRVKRTDPTAINETFVVYDGSGNVVGASTLSSTNGGTLTTTLAAAGPYSMLIYDRDNDRTGPYRVYAQRLNGACNASGLACGRTAMTTIGSAAEIDSYILGGVSAGDAITIRMTKTGTSSLVEQLELYAGNGTSLGANASTGSGAALNITLALTPPYSLLARDANNAATGSYQLSLQKADNSCQGFTFTDQTLTAGETIVRAAHVIELRSAVDTLRGECGLAPFGYTDPDLSGVVVRAEHVNQLRQALGQAYTCRGLAQPAYTDPLLTPGETPVRAVHLAELRAAVRAIQ